MSRISSQLFAAVTALVLTIATFQQAVSVPVTTPPATLTELA